MPRASSARGKENRMDAPPGAARHGSAVWLAALVLLVGAAAIAAWWWWSQRSAAPAPGAPAPGAPAPAAASPPPAPTTTAPAPATTAPDDTVRARYVRLQAVKPGPVQLESLVLHYQGKARTPVDGSPPDGTPYPWRNLTPSDGLFAQSEGDWGYLELDYGANVAVDRMTLRNLAGPAAVRILNTQLQLRDAFGSIVWVMDFVDPATCTYDVPVTRGNSGRNSEIARGGDDGRCAVAPPPPGPAPPPPVRARFARLQLLKAGAAHLDALILYYRSTALVPVDGWPPAPGPVSWRNLLEASPDNRYLDSQAGVYAISDARGYIELDYGADVLVDRILVSNLRPVNFPDIASRILDTQLQLRDSSGSVVWSMDFRETRACYDIPVSPTNAGLTDAIAARPMDGPCGIGGLVFRIDIGSGNGAVPSYATGRTASERLPLAPCSDPGRLLVTVEPDLHDARSLTGRPGTTFTGAAAGCSLRTLTPVTLPREFTQCVWFCPTSKTTDWGWFVLCNPATDETRGPMTQATGAATWQQGWRFGPPDGGALGTYRRRTTDPVPDRGGAVRVPSPPPRPQPAE